MAKLSVSEIILICVIVTVLLACTILALLLGFVVPGQPVQVETLLYYIPFTLKPVSTATITPTTKYITTVKENTKILTDFSIISSTVTEKQVIEEKEEEENECECPDPPPPPIGCIVPQKPEPILHIPIQKPTTKLIEQYPYLVSLSEPIYADEADIFKFVCTGVALENRHILTGDCVNGKNYRNIIVRSGSDQWYHGGIEHRIKHIRTLNKGGLTILTLDKPINDHPVKIQKNNLKWTVGKIVGWDRDPSSPLMENVLKINEVSAAELICENGICSNGPGPPCDDRNIGQPLLSSGTLVGLVTGTGCDKYTKHSKQVFKIMDLKKPVNKNWIQEQLLKRNKD